MKFSGYSIDSKLLDALTSLNYIEPTKIQESTIVKGESKSRVLRFPSLLKRGSLENRCRISDFFAEVYISDERPVEQKKVNTAYRKMMYEKFGEQYYEQLKERLTCNIEINYMQSIQAMNRELNKITDGKHSASEMEK